MGEWRIAVRVTGGDCDVHVLTRMGAVVGRDVDEDEDKGR